MKLDVCDTEDFGRLESSEKTFAILGDRWWPQTAKQDGDRMSAQLLEVSLLGVGTVLRLERDTWLMVKWLRQATSEYATPPLPPRFFVFFWLSP